MMAASAHAKPISRREDALAIVQRLIAAGHVAYFAGGCVRDMLLALEPKDFDVATSASPDDVRRLFPRSQGVGQAFGVVLVREGRSIIEVATFRADGSYSDGRRPDEVHFAGPEEDAARRDFTINGLFFDPTTNRVIDFVEGEADLKKRVLRAIGDPEKRFAEDYLRLLRAVRFAARFDLTIDPATVQAIQTNASKLPRIAPERIADELRAMFTASRDVRVEAEEWLEHLGLSAVILRHVLEASGVADRKPFDLDDKTFHNLPRESAVSFALALASWTVDALLARGLSFEAILATKMAAEIERALRQTLRLSNDESAALRVILGAADLLLGDVPRIARLKRFLAQSQAKDACSLLAAIRDLGSYGERIGWILEHANSFPPDQIAPPPLVTGDDLVAAGYPPSPRFKAALDAAYDAQLEDRAADQAVAMNIAVGVLNSAAPS